ncbi:hypothetical protein FQT01_12445 [Enterococcus faecalis]|uniref:DUF7446 family protein n=1 Tax=Enterococcus faecalis TaxID=1351 RepID=UPI001A95BCAB|nr:hypothetical protein [Enterococcus faecalis]MBO1106103.1 hypothetical protein [Enterococcus faecalis]
MAYEKLRLVTASVSGDIYLSKTKDGLMDVNSRRIITDEAIQAVTDWFFVNKRKTVRFKGIDGKEHSLFYTSDKEKAKKILAILEEEKQMKFYEIKEPYFALIAAKDEKQCLKLYKDIVCEVEDEKEFLDDMKTIDKYEAFKMLAKSHTEEGDKTGAEEAFNQLENLEKDGEVLLIDGGLI